MTMMVIAHHLILTAYGWWLPNDPRGSTSQCIASDVIVELGALHFGRKKVQPLSRDIKEFYRRAREVLKYPLLTFDEAARVGIAEAFEICIRQHRYTCYACAILWDHTHLLIRKHKHLAEDMIENFQLASARLLRDRGFRAHDHPVWAEGGWKVFLDHPDDIRRTIPYIDDNPTKLQLPRQNWTFVTLYDGWPLHPGHDADSPFARAMRRD